MSLAQIVRCDRAGCEATENNALTPHKWYTVQHHYPNEPALHFCSWPHLIDYVTLEQVPTGAKWPADGVYVPNISVLVEAPADV